MDKDVKKAIENYIIKALDPENSNSGYNLEFVPELLRALNSARNTDLTFGISK